MYRNGFDENSHPFQLQMRICGFPDYQGLQNKKSVTLDLSTGKIISYHTGKAEKTTVIREYIADEDDLKELYSFLTLDAIKKFEALPDSEKDKNVHGYYDWADLRYLLIAAEGRVSDGKRHYIFSNDPIQKAIDWMHKVTPSDFWQ